MERSQFRTAYRGIVMLQPIDLKSSRMDPAELLGSTPFIESDAPEVVDFARRSVGDAAGDVEKGVKLFYAVRDEIRYDPYRISLTEDCFRATTVLRDGEAFCIPKAILLAAAARALGIPSALGFSDVVNHLTTEKLKAHMGGAEVFTYHGYTLLHLAGKWVKATTAFNLGLCERFGVLPLEFDGVSDALLHPYDKENRKHMEYIRERGVFADFPFEEISEAFRRAYPPPDQGIEAGGQRFEDETPLDG